METVMDTKTKEAMRVLMWLKYNELDTFTRQNIFKDLFNSTFDYVSYDVIDDVLDQEVLRGNIEVVCRTVLPAILRKVKKMMHSTYDEKRILDWIGRIRFGGYFMRDTVIDQLAPISSSLVDYLISQEVKRGTLYQSHPTSKFYTKMKSNKVSNTEKCLSDLETVDTKIKNRLLDIEALLKKISDKVDALPDKKPRLWQPHNTPGVVAPKGALYFDVMLANGEVVTNMRADHVSWINCPGDPTNVIAWREAE
jgi:hypothetical protein